MYRIAQLAFALLLCVTLTGCYHARIETGLTPSAEVIDIPFAKGFIFGLVPPDVVKAGETCTSGVAIVETQHSFVNQLVASITFGIFTPMHITVTCASGGAMGQLEGDLELNVAADASAEEIINTFEQAAAGAANDDKRVLVRFE